MGRRMVGSGGRGVGLPPVCWWLQGIEPGSPVRASTVGRRPPAAAAPPAPAQTACLQSTGSYTPPATAPHIMMIVDENTSYGVGDGSPYVIGNSNAPYINNTLIRTTATHR